MIHLKKRKAKLLFPEHHLSHTASAYYPSPFDDDAILTNNKDINKLEWIG